MKAFAKRILPRSVWRQVVSLKNAVATPSRVQKYMEMAGYTVYPIDNYHSALTSVSDLRSTVGRWSRPSALAGIPYDLDRMKQNLSEMLSRYLAEFLEFPTYEELRREGFGPGYTAVDALTLYMMIRHVKPKRYVEVGSGLSTYYCSLAAASNAREGRPLAMTCIEPYPFEKLSTIPGIQLIVEKVQDVGLSLFHSLEQGDVLFIDSSHMLKVGGDVPFLILEVLPLLHGGVVVHIHDVPFPFNIPYPPELWVFGLEWPMLWNEAMVVQAFLAFNSTFRIEMSTPLLRHFDEPFLRDRIPIYETVEQNPNTFSSLWLVRTP